MSPLASLTPRTFGSPATLRVVAAVMLTPVRAWMLYMISGPTLASSLKWRYMPSWVRSEEHTSELQSPDHLVCRLLLEKKKKINKRRSIRIIILTSTEETATLYERD